MCMSALSQNLNITCHVLSSRKFSPGKFFRRFCHSPVLTKLNSALHFVSIQVLIKAGSKVARIVLESGFESDSAAAGVRVTKCFILYLPRVICFF